MKIKSGQWYRLRNGQIGYVFGVMLSEDAKFPGRTEIAGGSTYALQPDGSLYEGSQTSNYDIVEHLPDCDSFNWKPKLQLREGAYYKTVKGIVRGPCKPSTDRPDRPWSVSGVYYKDDGTNNLKGYELVEEVPDPNPKPVYRAFASAEEFAPHRDKWIKRFYGDGCFKVVAYDDAAVYTRDGSSTYTSYFDNGFTFEDGTPFGVKVS